MARRSQPPSQDLVCSFCGKDERSGAVIIPGPGVNICGDCVEICTRIMTDNSAGKKRAAGEASLPALKVPPPSEMSAPTANDEGTGKIKRPKA